MNNFSAKVLTKTAVIAALYALCTILFAPISYGAVQFRISESLCVLAFFYPEAVFGLTVGCFIANLFGNGPLDIILGTLATLIASSLSFLVAKKIKNAVLKFIVCSLFPIIINAILVPFTFLVITELKALYLISSLQVLFGQAVVIFTLGALLFFALNKRENALNKRL